MMATPIGNLEDITLRALRVLKEADIVACEDTRVLKVLLNAYELKKECISLHQHTTMKKVERLLDRVEKGEKAVYISDAGTPGMNDPVVSWSRRPMRGGFVSNRSRCFGAYGFNQCLRISDGRVRLCRISPA